VKLVFRLVCLVTLGALCGAGASLNREVAAQSATPTASPEAGGPTPTKPDAASKQPERHSAPQTQQQLSTPREQREKAYAKILEGQRFLSNVRRGNAESNLRSAQKAFEEAATFDPTLAEVHNALAEIAFYYPPYNLDQAIRSATKASHIDPNNFGARRLLSRLYTLRSGLRESNLDKKTVDLAVAELKEAARLNPNDAETWALLGEFYLGTGRPEEAIVAMTNWGAAPATSDTRFFQVVTNGRELSVDAAAARLGQALMSVGRMDQAVIALRRAVSLEPENKDYIELLTQALATSGSGDKAAIRELETIVRANPSNTTALRALARAQARSGSVDDAAATLRAGIKRPTAADQDRLLLRLDLAEIFSEAARYQDAIAIYEELLKERGVGERELTSDDDKEYVGKIMQEIVRLEKSAGRMAEASATIERLRRLLGKDDPTPVVMNIDLLREQGKKREALEAIRAAQKSFPQQVLFTAQEAQALADLGQTDEAVALTRKRLNGSIEDFNVYVTISVIYTQGGRGREAVEAARKALELATAQREELIPSALFALSSAQERAGDTKGSEESLRRVLSKDPKNATALNNLGYFLIERNERLKEALDMIQRAVLAEPTNASFLDSLGWAHFKLGNLEDAERYLSEAARRDSTSTTIHEHLGDLYQRRGKTEQARAAWQKALLLSVEAEETKRIKAKLSGKSK
jgi:tetratricopeptide (TPR) repeat protein